MDMGLTFSGKNETPLFVFTPYTRIALVLSGLACFLAPAVFGLTFNPIDYFFEGILFSIVGIFVYALYTIFSAHVIFARFYTESFKVSGRKFKKEFFYSQIDDVIFVTAPIGGGLVTISVVGEEDPLSLMSNPKNSALHTDLYTWLMQKKASKHNEKS